MLLKFSSESFLNDSDLAQQHAINPTVAGMYKDDYWVSTFPTQESAAGNNLPVLIMQTWKPFVAAVLKTFPIK